MKKACLLVLLLSLLFSNRAFAGDKNHVYYEIFVASYCDSDGDGTGDLKGVAAHLDDLAALGITGIWLMPINASPSYHKYDVADYYQVDPAYGTLEDLEQLANDCREKGIALILDLVLNHTATSHEWFQKALEGDEVYQGYYHFSKENTGGLHQAPNGLYYEGDFGGHMPDLNLQNPAVFNALVDIASFYLDRGITGFRLDAVKHYTKDDAAANNAFLQAFFAALRATHPKVYMVGEVWADDATILRYYASGMDSIFNYPFSQNDGSIVKSIQRADGWGLAQKVEAWQRDIKANNPHAIDAPFLSNHDNARSAGFLLRKLPLQRLAAASYLLLPGNPFIYYGEELGMTGSGRDENKRQPYVWSTQHTQGMTNPPPNCEQSQSLAEGYYEQLNNPNALLQTYQALLSARKAYPQIADGVVRAVDLGEQALCALLYADSVMVIHNFATEHVHAMVETDFSLATAFANEGDAPTLVAGRLSMPAQTSVILEKKP